MKLTYKDLNHPALVPALVKLRNYDRFKIKTAYAVAKICEKLETEINSGRDIYVSLMKKYPELFKEREEAKPTPEMLKAYNEEFEGMMAIEFELPYSKIEMNDLEEIPFSAQEISALEPLLTTGPQLVA